MKWKGYNSGLVMALLFIGASCSKMGEGTGRYPADLTGTIYYDWASDGILNIRLPSGQGGAFLEYNTKLNSFDVSRDGKYRLIAMDESTLGKYDIRFSLSDLKTGKTEEEFIYNSPAGNRYCNGYLSPDNSLILITSNDKKDGITVVKRNGEFVTRLEGINGESFDFNETRLWLPNNELLLTLGKYIIRLAPPYTSGKLVKEMNYADWGDLAVNHAGTQLAFRIDQHLYTMDMNGQNVTQVTTSNFTEAKPVFSPDGKYLLVGSHYRPSGAFGYTWRLKIIPNDGKSYNVDPNEPNSPGVIPVIWNGKDDMEWAGGEMIWK